MGREEGKKKAVGGGEIHDAEEGGHASHAHELERIEKLWIPCRKRGDMEKLQ